jgi:excisionase family DNA binding protein
VNELTTLAYLAGVLDSDGYIGIGKKKAGKWAANYQARVQVKQVTPEAVDLFHETFGGHRYHSRAATSGARPLWVWGVHSRACRPVLESLLPYLRIKPDRARNALALCDVNERPGGRRFPVPEVRADEPVIGMAEAARRLGKSYGTVIQAVRNGSVPHVRTGPRQVFIPVSFLPVWAERGSSPTRDPAIGDEMEALYLRAKELNRVGV